METIKSTIAQNLGGFAHKLADPSEQFDIYQDVPDLSGKVAVVTGGSEGIGFALSFILLRANVSKLYIMSLSKDVMDDAIKDISTKLGQEYADRITWLHCDLTDYTAVTATADKIRNSTDHLDILCLNAARGIMTAQKTPSGIDQHMALNHIGHVVFASHLLPLLKSSAEKGTVRIQVQASNAHENAPKEREQFASLEQWNKDFGPMAQYGRTKLANILYVKYLDRHLHSAHPNILINATHPGIVETAQTEDYIHEAYPILGYGMSVGMRPFRKDQWMGSASGLFAATKTDKSGQYICPPATPEQGSELANDTELSEHLMKVTREIIREKYADQSVNKGCPLKDY